MSVIESQIQRITVVPQAEVPLPKLLAALWTVAALQTRIERGLDQIPPFFAKSYDTRKICKMVGSWQFLLSLLLNQGMNERRNFRNLFAILKVVKLHHGKQYAAAQEFFRPCDVVAEFLDLVGKGGDVFDQNDAKFWREIKALFV
jgi:hypothetical protein